MYYQVQISLDLEFTQLVVNKMVEDVTDYSVTKDLEHFTVYYWRVKTIDPMSGAKSAWSVPCAFKIKAQDVTIVHSIDKPTANNAYIWYGSDCFGLEHKFIRSYDTECITPDAQIGFGMCNVSGIAQIGVSSSTTNYCPGVCVPQWDGFDIEYLLTEDNFIILTEDGIGLILEF